LLKNLLNAGNSPNLEFAYDLFFIFTIIIYVKIAMTLPSEPWIALGKTRRKSAGVRSISTSEASQRLDAGDLTYAYLVGLFEGDGYFSITKKGKYLTYVLGIEISIRDVQLIYKIKSLLGVGVVSFRKRDNIEMVTLRIRDKDHLKKFIIPIFDKYPMLSNKQYDYLRFRNALLSGIIYSSELPEYSRTNESLNTVESIINTYYFPA
jgi:ubiquinol-cytochrome c reductase cytochrome b subunit